VDKLHKVRKIVLAYSGGLDTSVILRWLKEEYKCEVIAFAVDLGQGEELTHLKEKALETGASKIYIEDLREEFVCDYIFPALMANATYESGYLLGTSLSRPLIAKAQIEIAKKEKADYVSHGATGKGNDQVRFELSYRALNPEIKIIAPWRQWDFKSRESLISYAKKWGIPVPTTIEKPYSTDRNIFHISFEGGVLEDPFKEPPEDMFVLTKSPFLAKDKPSYIEIGFEDGIPVSIDGQSKKPVELLEELNLKGGENGIGRVDIVENRYVGMKSRGVYETPGGTILHIAHKAIESITMDREVMYCRDLLIPKFSRLIYYGFWFSPEMALLRKLMEESQKGVTGTVRLKLYKGNCIVVGRKSPHSLYDTDLASFDQEGGFKKEDAEGFININALRLKLRKDIK
jgi:argininosuccinate synthase